MNFMFGGAGRNCNHLMAFTKIETNLREHISLNGSIILVNIVVAR